MERSEMVMLLASAQKLSPAYVDSILDQVIARFEKMKPVVDKLRVVFSAMSDALAPLMKARNGFSLLAILFARRDNVRIDRSLVIAGPRKDREPLSRVFPGGVWFGRQMMNRHAWRWVPRQM